MAADFQDNESKLGYREKKREDKLLADCSTLALPFAKWRSLFSGDGICHRGEYQIFADSS